MSIMDTVSAAIGGAAAGATTMPEARATVREGLSELLEEILLHTPLSVEDIQRISNSYGFSVECEDGRPRRVILN